MKKRAKYKKGMLPPPPAIKGLPRPAIGKVDPAPWGLLCRTRRDAPVLLLATFRRVRVQRIDRRPIELHLWRDAHDREGRK